MNDPEQSTSMDEKLKAVQRGLDRGMLSARIFSDPEIFEVEMERLFSRAWLYVGHESEVSHPGDYVVRDLGRDSFLFVRGRDGEIRVLLNTCRHRGNLVCAVDRGNAASFRCPYHGWVYDNTGFLLGVPSSEEAYGESFDRAEWSLIPVPRMAACHGLVFASLDPNAPPLDEYLGGMKWYLDVTSGRSDSGLEVVGTPHRWLIEANWKLPADNFVGDLFHFQSVHQSMAEIGAFPDLAGDATLSYNVSLDNGHGLMFAGNFLDSESSASMLQFRGYSDLLVESFRRNLLPGQMKLLEEAPAIIGNVFPNLGYFDVVLPDLEGRIVTCITLRVWQPVSVGKTEICSWFLVEKDAPQEFKELSYNAYMRNFGGSGAFEQDDTKVWSGVTRTSKGVLGRGLFQNVSGGMTNRRVDSKFPGPGEVSLGLFSDANWRGFYRRYLEYLSGEA